MSFSEAETRILSLKGCLWYSYPFNTKELNCPKLQLCYFRTYLASQALSATWQLIAIVHSENRLGQPFAK